MEDNAVEREGLAVVLRREGYTVALTANGREALAYLRDHPAPDLILLDMLMPVLDGWGFLKEFQRVYPPPRVPVLIAAAPVLTREWAGDHGCGGLVHKPIVIDELLAEVQRCLGE